MNTERLHGYLDQRDWLPDDGLVNTDRAAMLALLPVRTLYLKRELVKFAASVPAVIHAASGGRRGCGRVRLRRLEQSPVAVPRSRDVAGRRTPPMDADHGAECPASAS